MKDLRSLPFSRIRPLVGIVEPRHQVGHGRLAGPAPAHERHHRASGNDDIEVLHHRAALTVFERHLVEPELRHHLWRLHGARLVGFVLLHGQHVEHALHGGQRPLELRERVHDVPHRAEQQERVPLERHDVAHRRPALQVQQAAVPDDHDVDGAEQQPPGGPDHHLAPLGEELLAKDRVPAPQELQQLERLAPESPHHADAGERLPHAPVDPLHVLAHHAVDGPDAAREHETDDHDSGNDGQGRHRQPPVQREENHDGDQQAHHGNRGGDDRQLQEAGRGVHVAGDPRQDASRLHVPERRQRQVQQAVEERPPQREHHLDVQQLLAVVLEHVGQPRQHDDGNEQSPNQMQPVQPFGERERRQQDVVDDEAHEKRLRHLEARRDEGQAEHHRRAEPVGPEPRHVLADVLSPLAFREKGVSQRRGDPARRDRHGRRVGARSGIR